ncbi:Coproporphyrinogen III oxidase, oxygen-independent [hydrothermal vent metagenome]|uniref:Oxygen-independent coproporphyrinogen III oxidase n=1 Tax=hydrothermal vent metagenome TaxID=652676 RepID=A0A3B0ZP51_9ZZZZ
MLDNHIEFDAELIQRYAGSGPRYTSYPTAMEFTPAVNEQAHVDWVRESNRMGRPLSLYVHVPFCAHVCYYCACNKVVTANRDKAEPFLENLFHEIRLQAILVDSSRRVEQLHWGGGTPTFLSDEQLGELMRVIGENFNLHEDDLGEYSIEIDPRELRENTLRVLREIGFNRISLGVQDFDPDVQAAVHRVQTDEQTLGALDQARELGFRSINIDLMYGLPLQTVAGFSATLDAVIAARPDRLSVFNYAHLPERFKPQRRINSADLPSAAEKLNILSLTIDKLTSAGYAYIGMDHFALADDELVAAQRSGSLQRNFQGYSTHAESDLIAMGPSAISAMPGGYSQNHTGLEDYYRDLQAGQLPIARGVAINQDDRLRAEIIQQLICNNQLDIPSLERRHSIQFGRYFSTELTELAAMQADGLVDIKENRLTISARGRLLVRNICKVFDAYRQDKEQKFSKMI